MVSESFGGAYNQNKEKMKKQRLMLEQSYQMSCWQLGETHIHRVLEPAVTILRKLSTVTSLRSP